MPHVDVHASAKVDLDDLLLTDSEAWADVVVAIEQVIADPKAIDKLTTKGDIHFGKQRGNVKPWQSMRRTGNLWRLRVLDTAATNYRVVYGYHWQTRHLCILAVVNKEIFNYDPDSRIGKRVANDWGNL